MNKNRTKYWIKLISIVLMVILLFDLTAAYIGANTYYTVRINYLYVDGTHAHDPYIATFPADQPVNVTVTNPNVNGYDPMMLNEGETNPLTLPNNGTPAKTTAVSIDSLNANVTYTVYYVAGLSHYRARFYLQNVYDDLYTTDQTLNAQYQDLLGVTGSFPHHLEGIDVEGFTTLFHEPDAIAADGSTVFRLYYDRNYYTVGFDLGEGGYGVEPIYAKYQTVYHVAEPKRLGYTFLGWARTDMDSAAEDADWHYIDENGNIISEAEATAAGNLLTLEGDQTIPANNTYYKAIWSEDTTRYRIIYWIENPDDEEYTVIAAKEIADVPSGTKVSYEDIVSNYGFFKYNLAAEFPEMSADQLAELNGMGRYFEFNEEQTRTYENQFDENHQMVIKGDGTSRISLFYDRKEITQRFFYGRKTDAGKYQILGNTKGFSNSVSGYGPGTLDTHLGSDSSQNVWMELTTTAPQIASKYADRLTAKEYYSAQNSATYYYYEVKSKYYADQRDTWLLDALDPYLVTNSRKEGDNDYARFGAWTVEFGTEYYYNHKSNQTVKGFYQRLDKQLLYRESYLTTSADQNPPYVEDPLVLNYMAFWVNAKNASWNKKANILNFTYKNYVEILAIEYDENGEWNGQGGYIDTKKNEYTGRIYGLLPENVIETFDGGTQYDDISKRDAAVKTNQTAASLIGYTLMTDAQVRQSNSSENPFFNQPIGQNPQCYWSAKDMDGDGTDDFDANHHCDVSYFYRRNQHNIRFVNNNITDKVEQNVFFGRPLADKEYIPTYNNPPELADYFTFEGWYYTPYYFRQVDFSTLNMPDTDITLYAKWSPKKIDVVFYNNYNEYYEDTNRIVLGYDEDDNPITDWTVEYGSYVPINRIPADVHDESSTRPELTPIAEKASFAGWYYIRNRVPRRFEPENVPVTALNAESTGDNAKLKLFAEWVTQDVAKYKISYVRADDPTVEVAPPTIGRAYVWKTRTFSAKSGNELSGEYKWTEEHEDEGTNWWPTVNSHSIVVKANEEGDEYRPNVYTFEYIQKEKVHYRVQYLDADTRRPINTEGHDIEKITTHASVKEDAKVIPGYISDPSSATLILSASTASTPEEQKAEELRNNVITFLYHKNTTEYIYETEYYTHDLDGDGYSLFASESLEIPIAAQGDTTVSINDIFARAIPRQIIADGFERSPNKAEYTYVAADGSVSENPIPVADNGSVTIVDTDKKTIRLYFDRKHYAYSYEYVDHTAAKAYEQASESERENMWNGVLATFPNAGSAQVGSTVTLNVPTDYSYTSPSDGTVTAYTRMTNTDGTLNDVKLSIQPAEDGSLVNHIKIYYRKDVERDLNYRMICVNDNGETDYDAVTGDPLFGRLSVNRQTVESYDQIQAVTFYDTNSEKITQGNQEVDLHLHKYTFLGWYTSPEYNESDPAENRLTANAILSKEDLGTNGSLPDRDAKYYALVKQEMVKMDVDFYFCDDYTKTQMDAMQDSELKAYLQQKIADNQILPSGEYGGKEVIFTNPSLYQNHTQIAWHKSDGYSLYMQDIDDRVYKYEFAEWWEIDETQHNDLIPKHNWNGGEWSPDSLASQLSRTKNQHLIAVYTRREVTELPYTLNYNFISRTGEEKTYVKTGTLTGDDLNENSASCKITTDGFYALTDEFILANAPYERNFAEVLNWSDHPDYVIKDSVKGNEDDGTLDRIVTDVNAVQSKKNVYAHFRTAPNGEYQTISIPYGSNYEQSENMLEIECPETCEGRAFAYWAVRKSETGDIIAKSYDTLFDLCMMDSYWISPVYEGAARGSGEYTAALDRSQLVTNADEDWMAWTWTGDDSNGEWVYPDGMTFRGLQEKVIFVRLAVGETPAADWANIWNQTDDLTVVDGAVFTLNGFDEHDKMTGTWSESNDFEPSITLTHIDDTRNTWTDENNEVPANGSTDILYTDFEIAFEDGAEDIYTAPAGTYRTGVVFELCASLPADKTFDPTRDYNQVSDPASLKAAILNNNTTYVYHPDKPTKTRNLQISDIPQSALTNRDRVQYGKSYRNTYKVVNNEKTYINARYLLKATAYLVKDGEVTLSNSVYICLAAEADKNLTIDSGVS